MSPSRTKSTSIWYGSSVFEIELMVDFPHSDVTLTGSEEILSKP